ncbi:MAG TPA: hypothetical protein VGK84_12100, partial [Candidatus Tumulicola sp.]
VNHNPAKLPPGSKLKPCGARSETLYAVNVPQIVCGDGAHPAGAADETTELLQPSGAIDNTIGNSRPRIKAKERVAEVLNT